jgi:hypothetical protein
VSTTGALVYDNRDLFNTNATKFSSITGTEFTVDKFNELGTELLKKCSNCTIIDIFSEFDNLSTMVTYIEKILSIEITGEENVTMDGEQAVALVATVSSTGKIVVSTTGALVHEYRVLFNDNFGKFSSITGTQFTVSEFNGLSEYTSLLGVCANCTIRDDVLAFTSLSIPTMVTYIEKILSIEITGDGNVTMTVEEAVALIEKVLATSSGKIVVSTTGKLVYDNRVLFNDVLNYDKFSSITGTEFTVAQFNALGTELLKKCSNCTIIDIFSEFDNLSTMVTFIKGILSIEITGDGNVTMTVEEAVALVATVSSTGKIVVSTTGALVYDNRVLFNDNFGKFSSITGTQFTVTQFNELGTALLGKCSNCTIIDIFSEFTSLSTIYTYIENILSIEITGDGNVTMTGEQAVALVAKVLEKSSGKIVVSTTGALVHEYRVLFNTNATKFKSITGTGFTVAQFIDLGTALLVVCSNCTIIDLSNEIVKYQQTLKDNASQLASITGTEFNASSFLNLSTNLLELFSKCVISDSGNNIVTKQSELSTKASKIASVTGTEFTASNFLDLPTNVFNLCTNCTIMDTGTNIVTKQSKLSDNDYKITTITGTGFTVSGFLDLPTNVFNLCTNCTIRDTGTFIVEYQNELSVAVTDNSSTIVSITGSGFTVSDFLDLPTNVFNLCTNCNIADTASNLVEYQTELNDYASKISSITGTGFTVSSFLDLSTDVLSLFDTCAISDLVSKIVTYQNELNEKYERIASVTGIGFTCSDFFDLPTRILNLCINCTIRDSASEIFENKTKLKDNASKMSAITGTGFTVSNFLALPTNVFHLCTNCTITDSATEIVAYRSELNDNASKIASITGSEFTVFDFLDLPTNVLKLSTKATIHDTATNIVTNQVTLNNTHYSKIVSVTGIGFTVSGFSNLPTRILNLCTNCTISDISASFTNTTLDMFVTNKTKIVEITITNSGSVTMTPSQYTNLLEKVTNKNQINIVDTPIPTSSGIVMIPSIAIISQNIDTSSTLTMPQLNHVEQNVLINPTNYNASNNSIIPLKINPDYKGDSFSQVTTIYGVFVDDVSIKLSVLPYSSTTAFLLPTMLPVTIKSGSYRLILKSDGITTYVSYDSVTFTEFPLNSVIKLGSRSIQLAFNASSGIIITDALPISNVCFVKDTPVQTDQGIVPIQDINYRFHTINKNKILTVTKTITPDTHLVQIEKGALGNTKRTILSKNHKIAINHKMVKAEELVNGRTIIFIPYDDETLYNVLCERHVSMIVNGMTVETLDPTSITALLYKSKYAPKEKETLILRINQTIKSHDKTEYDKIVTYLKR